MVNFLRFYISSKELLCYNFFSLESMTEKMESMKTEMRNVDKKKREVSLDKVSV